MKPPIAQEENLLIGGISAADLVKQFGSPLYVYDAEAIKSRCRIFQSALQGIPHKIHYACKANSNLRLMALIRSQGYGVDAVSRGEIMACKKAGFQTDEITFTGNNVTAEDLAWIHDQGITMILDSVDQVRRLGDLRPGTSIGLRLNITGAGHHEHVITGGEGSKFGIISADVPTALETASRRRLKVVGVHQHIGSGILDVDLWMECFNQFLVAAEAIDDLEWVDGGGG
ncbi:MAG: alanine racemase, partial [Planctomycetota bacterium]